MHETQRKRIIDRHRDSLTRHGYHPHALYWSNREIQEIRFRVLAEIGIVTGDSVLDVGCGFADFSDWAAHTGRAVHYTGIDLSPDLIGVARERHPDLLLHIGELEDGGFEPASFDWVILSGSLNEQLHDGGAYARRMFLQMYTLCRNGVAFNLLNARHVQAHDLQSLMPDEVLAFCQSITPRCKLIQGYLPIDFTVYLYREGKA
jgi:SAM-dependent methyltransferase